MQTGHPRALDFACIPVAGTTISAESVWVARCRGAYLFEQDLAVHELVDVHDAPGHCRVLVLVARGEEDDLHAPANLET